MVDRETLEAISQMMDEKLKPISERLDDMDARLDGIDTRLDGMDARLDGMDARLDSLGEDSEITRDGVNSLLDWAEACSNVIKFPLPRVADK